MKLIDETRENIIYTQESLDGQLAAHEEAIKLLEQTAAAMKKSRSQLYSEAMEEYVARYDPDTGDWSVFTRPMVNLFK